MTFMGGMWGTQEYVRQMAGGPPPAAPAATMHDSCRDPRREGTSRAGGSSCEHWEGAEREAEYVFKEVHYCV